MSETPMFEDPKDFKPSSSKGRTFMEDGVWLLIGQVNRDLYVKVDAENAKYALSMQTFKAHHILNVQVGQPPLPLEPVFGSYDGWTFNGAALANVALMHPEVAEKLDASMKRNTSVIEEAKEGDVPPPDKLAKQKTKLHLAP